MRAYWIDGGRHRVEGISHKIEYVLSIQNNVSRELYAVSSVRRPGRRQPRLEGLCEGLGVRGEDCARLYAHVQQGKLGVPHSHAYFQDCRLLVVMGRDFVSALQPVAYCTVPGLKRM
jgi:hypothetical protein